MPHPALSSQPQNGGVVYASRSGAVSIIDSAVTGCSAGYVRRVELAALQQRLMAAGRETERATAASPRSLLATADRRRRLRGEQRCGLAHRLDSDGLLCWLCAPRRASRRPAAQHGCRSRDVEGGGPHPALCSQPQYGGVVRSSGSGAVLLIDSTVRDCSAGSVRRVELTACRGSAARQRVERCEGRGCLTPLLPRNRRPAASSPRITAVRSRSSAHP